MDYFEEKGDHILVKIKVVCRSPRSGFGEAINGRIKLQIKAPPVDGKANKEIIKYLAKILKIPQCDIEIVQGKLNREKVLKLAGLSGEELIKKIFANRTK